MITCGWCGTNYLVWQSHCRSCGGALPPPAGMDAGPPPPAAPRKLPEGFTTRTVFNPMMLLGLGFTGVGGLMTGFFVSVKSWAALFPGFFLLGGIGMIKQGIVHAVRTLDAFRNGTAVLGKIATVEIELDTQSAGQKPWIIIYAFELDGQIHEGKLTTLDSSIAEQFRKHQPVWVLAVKGNPARNTLYPPVRC